MSFRKFVIKPREKLAICLFYLSNIASLKIISSDLGYSPACTTHYVSIVCNLIITHFADRMSLPTLSELG